MNKIKLALVEDHAMLRRSIKLNLYFHPQFKLVIEAENGKDLIEKLADAKIDVVILDVRMPVMNGHDTLIYLKKNLCFLFNFFHIHNFTILSL